MSSLFDHILHKWYDRNVHKSGSGVTLNKSLDMMCLCQSSCKSVLEAVQGMLQDRLNGEKDGVCLLFAGLNTVGKNLAL